MRTQVLLVALVSIAITAGALAQSDGPKLYRWVDKEGKVHFDDALPPEVLDQARDEFSPKTGNRVGTVPRALTTEERAKLAADQAAAAQAAAAANDQARMETVMLASYETEADLARAYNARINLLKMTLQSTQISIESLQSNLGDQLASASDTELDHHKVFPIRIQKIAALHRELVSQLAFREIHKKDFVALNDEFMRMRARYRELRGSAPAGAATAPAATAPASGKP